MKEAVPARVVGGVTDGSVVVTKLMSNGCCSECGWCTLWLIFGVGNSALAISSPNSNSNSIKEREGKERRERMVECDKG